MKNVLLISLSFLVLGFNLLGQTNAVPASSAKTIAVSIVYDGSGSMSELVPSGDQQQSPKYLIANQAVDSIVKQLLAYSQDKQVEVQAGLVYFVGSKIHQAIPLASVNSGQVALFNKWTHDFTSPDGGTPLGLAIQQAQRQLAQSESIHKHILVITDGVSNFGVAPERVVHDLRDGTNSVPVYFVAFDVSAKVFDRVKAEGATVVSASDAAQLNARINQILSQKILLEAE